MQRGASLLTDYFVVAVLAFHRPACPPCYGTEPSLRPTQRLGCGSRLQDGIPEPHMSSNGERSGQPLLDRCHYAGVHLRGRPAVACTDQAAVAGVCSPAVSPAGVAHQLIDHPGWDAGVLQPGREGVPQVVWAS
jgi:hypothetical protein